jgi:hypothetical protein
LPHGFPRSPLQDITPQILFPFEEQEDSPASSKRLQIGFEDDACVEALQREVRVSGLAGREIRASGLAGGEIRVSGCFHSEKEWRCEKKKKVNRKKRKETRCCSIAFDPSMASARNAQGREANSRSSGLKFR